MSTTTIQELLTFRTTGRGNPQNRQSHTAIPYNYEWAEEKNQKSSHPTRESGKHRWKGKIKTCQPTSIFSAN